MIGRSLIALFALVACGGGGGGGGGGDDDGVADDASPNVVDSPPAPIDAPDPSTKQLGSTCTPDPNNTFGQGDCPSGFSCLDLTGGTNPWCSKTCTTNMDMCGQGYSGPGLPRCYLTVTPAGGGAAMTFCGVVCDDLTAGDTICPAATCNGTCPETLACTADLMGQTAVVAKGCQ